MSNGQNSSRGPAKTFHLLGNAPAHADFQEESPLCFPLKRTARDDVCLRLRLYP